MTNSLLETTMQISRPTKDQQLLSDVAAKALVAKTRWYHSFELRPGLLTPGSAPIDAGAALDALQVPGQLAGKKCLDVGAWDGPLTFELERRGASAYALDIQNPGSVGFETARKVLGSKSVHYRGSVYGLPFGDLDDLDLVVFRGVYYHLKYPLLAFERISAAMKPGGTLHFEGEGFINYAEDLHGRPASEAVVAVARTEVPICLSYPNNFKAASNWSIPNAACLRSWLTAAGFEVAGMQEFTENGAQRLFGYATKTRAEGSLVEHPLY